MNTSTTNQNSFLSERVKVLKGSSILILAARAGAMKAAGQDVISLSIGEPDWGTFDKIKVAAIDSIQKGKTKYTPPAGIPELRKAVAEQASQDLGIPYAPEQVSCSSGAKFILFAALQSLVNPGDEVIVIAPYWASYTTMVEMAEGVPHIVSCDESSDYKLTPEALEKNITAKTKVLMLNSPSNPTGKIYTKEELKALADVLKKYPRIVVMSDDIYNKLCFTEKVAPHILHVAPELKDRVIVINGASKAYSMTGWRLGWAVGPKDIIHAMSNYQSQSVSCPSAPAQYGAVEGIKSCDQDIADIVKVLKEKRDVLVAELKKIPHVKTSVPEGAFYLWVGVKPYLGKKYKGQEIKNCDELCELLLEDKLVAIVPGSEFGLDGYVRLSYALDTKKGVEAIGRIHDFLVSLT